MTYLFPFADFLWILQKEEYETKRYLYWLRRFFFRRRFVVSERLMYTARARTTLVFSVFLWVVSGIVATLSVSNESFLVVLAFLWIIGVPFAVLVANMLLTPFFGFLHARVRARAALCVREHSPMKIIAIAGSFGKTTTKYFLYELLRHRYRTQMTPGGVNTTSGIALWITKELAPSTELLIVEMDAYAIGEIAASASITPPSIGVITNVGDQHLMRFGTRARLAASLSELVAHARPGADIVTDAVTAKKLKPFVPNQIFRIADTAALSYRATPIHVPHLSDSNRENLARALLVADVLDIPIALVTDTCTHLELPDRRQKVGTVHGYEGIDDSYNISLTTARAGLVAARALADAKGKKLFVVTAGIPEFGPEEPESNRELGRSIASLANHAVILGSMFAPDISTGIAGVIPETFPGRFEEFLKSAPELFPPSEWIALFEPPLPDLYY